MNVNSSAITSDRAIYPQPRRRTLSGIAAMLLGPKPLKTRAPAVRRTSRCELVPEADAGEAADDRTMSVVSSWFCPPLHG